MKIYAQKSGTYTKQELLDMATLLIKGGYTVRRGKAKIDGKPVEYVEFSGDAASAACEEVKDDAGAEVLS